MESVNEQQQEDLKATEAKADVDVIASNNALSSDTDSDNDEEEKEKLNAMLADVVGEISIKQKLIDELELSQKRLRTMRAHYEQKLSTLANRIRETEQERDKVLANISASSDGRSDGKSKSKISEEYALKLNSMQTELKKLQAAKREHTKLLRNQSHYETQLRTLRSDLTSLKQLKVKLMRQLREEAQKFRQSEQKSRKMIAQLEKQQQAKDSKIRSLEADKNRKEVILKRKMEEVSALRRQQKSNLSAKAAGRVVQSTRDEGAWHHVDPRILKTSWNNLEKLISTVIVKRQTLTHLDKDLERWMKQRELVGKKLERLLKKHEKAVAAAADIEIVNLSELMEQIDTLRDNMTYIQDNISECQKSIVHMEEFKGEDMDADRIFVTSSMQEAMFLLEHCTNLAIGNGLMYALKTDECKEMEAKLHQEQMESIFQRDMLQYLIYDKVDVAVDHGLIWQDNEDNSDDDSGGSLSPVDSLEEQELVGQEANVNSQPPITGPDIVAQVNDDDKISSDVDEFSLVTRMEQNSDRSGDQFAASCSAELSPTTDGKPMQQQTDVSLTTDELPRPALARGVINTVVEGSDTMISSAQSTCPLQHSHTVVGHSKAVLSVFATGTYLYTASKDQTAKVWDLSGGVECRSFGSHPTSVVSVKYSASSQLVYTASAYLVSVWDPRRPACVYTLTSAGLSGDGSALAGSESLYRPISCPPGEINITDIALGSSSTHSLYTAAGNTVRTWDLRIYKRSESVKELQYFCGDLPFEYLYELHQWNFYSNMLGKNTYLDCILKYYNRDNNFVQYFQLKYKPKKQY